VTDLVRKRRRVTWIHLTQNSQVVAVTGNVITLGFTNVGARDSFVRGGDEETAQAAGEVLGGTWRIEAVVDPGAQPGAAAPAPAGPPPAATPDPAQEPPADYDQGPPPDFAAGQDDPPWSTEPPPSPSMAAREAIQPTRSGERPEVDATPSMPTADDDVHPDDETVDEEALGGAELLQRELGAKLIEEIHHQ